MKKKIVIVNNNRILSNYIEKGISNLGIEVYSVIDKYPQVVKKSIFHKYCNLFYRLFLNNKNYYLNLNKSLLEKFYKKSFSEFLKKNQNIRFDYGIVFRADKYETDNLNELNKHVDKLIAYQYDGVGDISLLLDKVSIFDHIYVFDKDDILNHRNMINFEFLSNFYIEEQETYKTEIKYELFYIGSYSKKRREALKVFEKYNTYFRLSVDKVEDECIHKNITITSKKLFYEKYIEAMKKCSVIIDLRQERHSGLSFRFFEAMYYNKKIITDNKAVLEYDFYLEDNILVVDFECIDLDEVNFFLKKQYKQIDEKIYKKYSLINWLKTAFNEK